MLVLLAFGGIWHLYPHPCAPASALTFAVVRRRRSSGSGNKKTRKDISVSAGIVSSYR